MGCFVALFGSRTVWQTVDNVTNVLDGTPSQAPVCKHIHELRLPDLLCNDAYRWRARRQQTGLVSKLNALRYGTTCMHHYEDNMVRDLVIKKCMAKLLVERLVDLEG